MKLRMLAMATVAAAKVLRGGFEQQNPCARAARANCRAQSRVAATNHQDIKRLFQLHERVLFHEAVTEGRPPETISFIQYRYFALFVRLTNFSSSIQGRNPTFPAIP